MAPTRGREATLARGFSLTKLTKSVDWTSPSTLLVFGAGFASAALAAALMLVGHRWRGKHSHRWEKPYFVVFGDSITQQGWSVELQGWVAQLSEWYQRRVDIINRGFSGYNTRWLWLMVDDMFAAPRYHEIPPLLVTVFLGANDATLPGSHQHVPLDEYKEKLAKLVQYFLSLGGASSPPPAVVIITPPPLNAKAWGVYLQSQGMPTLDRSTEVSRSYGEAAKSVGASLGVPVVDLWGEMEGDKGPQAFQRYLHPDGLHLSGPGNTRVFSALQRTILKHYPHLDPEAIEVHAPWHREVATDATSISVYQSRKA